ncbi:hypothetical protein BpOF4_10595 [Alkalihalophilus pseudofirmus OF4]|jgi:hypothetical protein|uniref:FbpB family small basic protein n=3 Tax=Alkalihalophilus TaxID=2893060 RepID=D3FUK2_ALKPO|nr:MULTISPECIES: FbpB family small basic protein [Alkalihalophilus]ADC50172.1 hypothetical protein BpOF4_10595 [Alkalihalophilus pseudofirmus OF4]ERN51217.1 hypothetical protein A33I_02285 [Alkalihalophilus marmarensis DSM 21297]MCM3490260.1 FbpB family small basic protein [Alkalihalophilus marmarensis]MDV2886582.1 FbpB family small basic protein [Alkalihalophilus pseudofirmus]MED1599920.1 FbpB family small basic protein [Alkalihalophilus marmarensis]
MRRQTVNFDKLVLENKKQLLNDPEFLDKLEKRLEEKKIASQKIKHS